MISAETGSMFFKSTMNRNSICAFGVVLAFIFCCGVYAGEEADFQRSKGYYTLQEYQLATEALDKYIAAYPKSERLEDARLLLAESHYQLKHYAEAAKAFDGFLAAHPNSARRSDAQLRALKSYAAIKDYAKCLKNAVAFIDDNRPKMKGVQAQDPLLIKMATALYHAGDSSYALKEHDKARGYWEELLAAMPKSPLAPDAADGLGWIYFDNKDFVKASASFFLVSETPNHPRAAWAKLMQARALSELKRTDDALAAIKVAPTLSGSSKELEAECALRSAEIAMAGGKLPEALAGFKRLAKEFPALPTTAAALASATSKFYEAKQFNEAAELAAEFLSVTAATPGAANRAAIGRIRARSLLAIGKKPEALEAARQALKDSDAAATQDRPASMMLVAELDAAEAPKLFKEVAEKFPLTAFALAAQYELARQAGEAAKFDEALTRVETLLGDLAKAPADRPGLDQLKRDALFAAGEFAFRKPDAKKAVEYLSAYQKTFGDKDEHADDVARKLGWSLHESADDAGAAKALDAALTVYSKSTHRAEMLYVRALAAGKLGNADEALKFDEALIQEFPASPFTDDALYDAATVLYKRKQLDPCLAKLDALLARPNLKLALKNPALQLRASVHIQSSKFAESLADADALLSSGGDAKLNLPALRLIKALSLLSLPGKETEALAALNELIAKGPADAPEIRQGISRRAYLLFKDKKYADAKEDFVLLSDPAKGSTAQEQLDAALHLALIYRELKENAQSKALFEKLSEQKLEGIAAFEVPFQLGNFLFEAADNSGAVKNYERALARAAGQKEIALSSLSAARLNLAWALKRSGEKDKAQKMFAELVKEEPSGQYAAEGLFERANVLVELGKTADALPLWQEVTTKFAESSFAERALFLLGQAFAQSGKFKEAAESFQLHVDKYPAINAKETLCGLAESFLHLNDLQKAKDSFNKVLGPKGIEADLDDTAERALLGLAEIALKADDAGGAKKTVLRILTEHAQSEWADAAFLIAGQASEALKEPEKAIGYYRKLLSDRPKSTHVPAAEERLRALGAPK